MLEIGMSGSMSGEGKRAVAVWPKLPCPSSTLPRLSGRGTGCSSSAMIFNKHRKDNTFFIESGHKYRNSTRACGGVYVRAA